MIIPCCSLGSMSSRPPARADTLEAVLVLSRGRFNVLVQMEQIVRIILFFDLGQLIVVGAVGGGHPIAFFCSHEVHIGPGGGVWARGLEKCPCPSNAPLIVCLFGPAPVYVEHELCVPMTIGHSVGRDAIGCT